MVRKTVPIEYGLPIFTPRYEARYAASTNSFPNSQTYVLGGCCVDSGSPRFAIIYVCPECLKAAKKWEMEHPNPDSH